MTVKQRHINIPVFIPHLGCPNQCVFCDQHAISGSCSFRAESICGEIDAVLDGIRDRAGEFQCEIAFFGGSFTGIDRGLMCYCLDTAEEYIQKGLVSGIRMSTRPDYITEDVLRVLSRYTVSEVELGIQSMSDRVLAAANRGHTAKETEAACRLLREANLPFVGQMMVGLPESHLSDEVHTAERICAMGAAGCRIYPTVVFRDTPLMQMTEDGRYTPLNVEDAVERSAACLEIFLEHGVKCLRIGLCETENLRSDAYFAGPNHPAMGELVGNALYYRRITAALDRSEADYAGRVLTIFVPKGDISLAIGQKQANKLKIENKYNVKSVRFIENPSLIRYNIELGSIESRRTNRCT